MFCPECGAENEENSKFCKKCGTKLKKSKKGISWWSKKSKNAKIGICVGGIAIILISFLLLSLAYSYSYKHPTESQYQSEVYDWQHDLDLLTFMGSRPIVNGTPSDYMDLFNEVIGSLSDLEANINETTPPRGYENLHFYLWNEVDNFKRGYQAESMATQTNDIQFVSQANSFFTEAHKYQDLAKQEQQRIGF